MSGIDIRNDDERTASSLYAPRHVSVLAARLSDEPCPAWLEALVHAGRLWADRRGWHAGSGEERVDLDPDDYLVLDATGELRTCHPLTFRMLFESYEPPRSGVEPGDASLGEQEEHDLQWLRISLPDGTELDGKSLHALRPIPVLATRLSHEPHPDWLERLMSEGELWRDRHNYYARGAGNRMTIGLEDYLVIDVAGKIESYDRDTFTDLYLPYEPSPCEVVRDEVVLGVTYHEGDVRFAVGYVSGWGGLRWRLSANGNGEGTLMVFGRDVDEDDGPQGVWTIETAIDPELAERALGTDGPCDRSEAQLALAGIVAEGLSHMDVSVLRRSLLDELKAEAPLPKGRRARS